MSRPSLDTVLKIGTTLVLVTLAFAAFRADHERLGRDKLDATRFVTDSIRRDAVMKEDNRDRERMERKLDAIGCRIVPQSFECP